MMPHFNRKNIRGVSLRHRGLGLLIERTSLTCRVLSLIAFVLLTAVSSALSQTIAASSTRTESEEDRMRNTKKVWRGLGLLQVVVVFLLLLLTAVTSNAQTVQPPLSPLRGHQLQCP